MTPDAAQLVAACVTQLSPFLPLLVEAGKAGVQKLGEAAIVEGGEAAWKKAQTIWARIRAHFGDDPEVTSAVTMVAAKPDDLTRQTLLAEVLGARLKEAPQLAKELFDLLGGQDAIQQVVAERGSWIENIGQRLSGTGTQTIRASDDSIISGIRQVKD